MGLPALRSLTLHDLASYSVPGMLKIRIQGLAELPREGPVLLLANRCSLLDPWLLSLAAGRTVQTGATSPLFWLPGLGDLASRLNTIPLAPEAAQGVEYALAHADALEKQQTVAIFGDHLLERRAEGPRYTVSREFLDVLLATRSERIPVVPVLATGAGWNLRLHKNPLLAPLLSAGARVYDTAYPPVLFTENCLRIGRPVLWREGNQTTTLQDFRLAIEDSLGALY